ncbi:hypothetical protein TBLA_0B01900 [Henningerozyma blattae CBS 6284]|uniref:Uncharacterized protein n=1 Tax=Henningerozyma blattae (strain ATCC 34711 / CBS 6284 / DSM 70876 / NBRC 10599 / NRRL Y-10934 / UCD 77-7) TaxID=1071380 RepID=I2GY32_HENB6|nr:hypothetical protein TBLA_0B01900 [Tetrapisispora blattae CBS 6284]CCH59034.1 hypothetical protein TBLA_0B01900 [Tetrapisispora blattae CBS 6284]
MSLNTAAKIAKVNKTFLSRKNPTANISLELRSILHSLQKVPIRKSNSSTIYEYFNACLINRYWLGARFVWYKYVVRSGALTLKPWQLSVLGNMSVAADNYFIPPATVKYYERFGKVNGSTEYEYFIRRNKVEAFAKGTLEKTQFREKWKVFIQDMDNVLPPTVEYKVQDFPWLVTSLKYQIATEAVLKKLLFGVGTKIQVHNKSSYSLLLSIILLQDLITIDSKVQIFETFAKLHRKVDLADHYKILNKICKKDKFLLNRVNTIYAESTNRA